MTGYIWGWPVKPIVPNPEICYLVGLWGLDKSRVKHYREVRIVVFKPDIDETVGCWNSSAHWADINWCRINDLVAPNVGIFLIGEATPVESKTVVIGTCLVDAAIHNNESFYVVETRASLSAAICLQITIRNYNVSEETVECR